MFDKLTSMEIFVSIAELGSFVKAAEHHNISPAMATKHIQRLEEYLNTKLLHRSTRTVELTQNGADYLLTCHRILSEIKALEENLLFSQNEIQGTIRIGMPSLMGKSYLLPILQKFQQTYQRIELEIEIDDQKLDLIKDKLDLLVRFDVETEPYLIVRPLLHKTDMIVVAGQKYWEKYGQVRQLSDLSQHNCLGCTESTIAGTRIWHFSHDQSVEISGTVQSNSALILIDYALENMGIVYQPKQAIANYLRDDRLVQAELSIEGFQESQLNLVYAKNEFMPKRLRTLIDYLIQAHQ